MHSILWGNPENDGYNWPLLNQKKGELCTVLIYMSIRATLDVCWISASGVQFPGHFEPRNRTWFRSLVIFSYIYHWFRILLVLHVLHPSCFQYHFRLHRNLLGRSDYWLLMHKHCLCCFEKWTCNKWYSNPMQLIGLRAPYCVFLRLYFRRGDD